MLQVNDATPVAMLTVGQLKEALQDVQHSKSRFIPIAEKYVFGIPGIMKLFNVSRPTAQEYKDTFLKPSIRQNGRKIVVDAERAMELFAERKGGRR